MKIACFRYLLLSVFFFGACSEGREDVLTGVKGRSYSQPMAPLNMAVIPGGSFEMGLEEDVFNTFLAKKRMVTVSPFYMDETEMSNNKYRQFVQAVLDSSTRVYAAEKGYIYKEEFFITKDKEGNDLVLDLGNLSYPINWDVKFDFQTSEALDPAARAEMVKYFYHTNRRNGGQMAVNGDHVVYQYYWVDYTKLLDARNKKEFVAAPVIDLMSSNTAQDVEEAEEDEEDDLDYPQASGNAFTSGAATLDLDQYVKVEAIPIYPDVLVWLHDFPGSFNEPLLENYFDHPAYDDYPVVGVNWKQARAFTYWRTNLSNAKITEKNRSGLEQRYRLPTEAEWEWAARGGVNNSPYPWGNTYVRDRKGCFMANFKPFRGKYSGEKGVVLQPVDAYMANQYGLYNMAGNVSEWTSATYHESAYEFVLDMNPNFEYMSKAEDPAVLKRKVIRGGSWKDISYYLQTGARNFEYEDSARSYIGFRTAQSYLGVPKK